MRILLVGPSRQGILSKSRGGVAVVCDALYEQYSQRNLVCDRLITGPNLSIGTYSFNSLSKILPGIFKFLFKHWNQGRNFLNALKISFLNISEYDVVHVHGLQGGSFRLLGLHNVESVKMVLTVHSYHMYDGNSISPSDLQIISNYHLVTHVSYSDLSRNSTLLSKQPNQSIVIPNGISSFNYDSDRKKIYDICFVGSLEERKGLARFFEDGLFDKRICFVGPDKSAGYFVKSIENVSNWEYLGVRDKSGCNRVMNESRILVVPSYSESFGLVYFEALASGIPIIGYGPVLKEYSGVYRRSLADKFIFPIDEGDALQDIVGDALLTEINITHEDRKLVSHITMNKFSWDTIASDYLRLYDNKFE